MCRRGTAAGHFTPEALLALHTEALLALHTEALLAVRTAPHSDEPRWSGGGSGRLRGESCSAAMRVEERMLEPPGAW